MPKPGVLHSVSPIYAAALFIRTQDARSADRPVCSWCGYYIRPGFSDYEGEPGTLDHLEYRPARPLIAAVPDARDVWRFDARTGPHAPDILVAACHGCNSTRARGRVAFQSFLDDERQFVGRVAVVDAWAWVRFIAEQPLPSHERAREAAWAWWPAYMQKRSKDGAERAKRSRLRRNAENALYALREGAVPRPAHLRAARALGWVSATSLALTKLGDDVDKRLPELPF